MTWPHDGELPRGLQDADFEQAELEEAAARARALERRGGCAHGSRVLAKSPPVYLVQRFLAVGEVWCCRCHRVGVLPVDDLGNLPIEWTRRKLEFRGVPSGRAVDGTSDAYTPAVEPVWSEVK